MELIAKWFGSFNHPPHTHTHTYTPPTHQPIRDKRDEVKTYHNKVVLINLSFDE